MEAMKFEALRDREPRTESEARHNEPQKPIKLLGPGDKDDSGHEVEDVYFSTGKYQIYLAADRVRYCLPEDYDTATQLRKKLYPFSQSFDNVQTMRADPNYRGSREFPARTLARAMAQAFDSESENAKRIIESLEIRMNDAIASHLRMKYVLANAYVMVFLVVFLVFALYALPQLAADDAFPFSVANVEKYAKLAILGALGAFLSVSIGIRKIHVEQNVRPLERVWTGGVRIVIGVIGAMFLGLALDAKLLSPGFGSEPTLWVFYLLAFLAGFSESVVPNTLHKTEQLMAEQGVASPSATQTR